MRETRYVRSDIDRPLEDAARATEQLNAQRWREALRPRARRPFAARTAKLTWSRTLVKWLVEELYGETTRTVVRRRIGRSRPRSGIPRKPRPRTPPSRTNQCVAVRASHQSPLKGDRSC
jgi:hypothetical protein